MSAITEIIVGAKGVEGIQQLLTPASIRPILQSMLTRPDALGACHLRRAKFKPGRKLTAYYDIEMGNDIEIGHSHALPARNAMRSIAITWALPAVLRKTLVTEEGALGREISARGLAEPFRQLIHAPPDAQMHVQVAPFDPHFPQLARLADPAHARAWLRDALETRNVVDAAHWAITPIRYRPRQRHVLRYDACSPLGHDSRDAAAVAGAPQTLFAKLYPDAGHQHFYALSHELADWFASATTLSSTTPSSTRVLRPLAYLPADTTMLYAQAQGAPLSEKLGGCPRTGEGAITRNLWQTGAALCALHRAPQSLTNGLPALELAAELKAITRTCEHIQALLPAVGQRIHALLARAADQYASLPQEAPTFIHGDFKADHVLATNDQLTLIDFDSCALADPAFDIGKFLADLAWWYGDAQQAALVQARNAFLSGYNLPLTDPRRQRAHVWEALIGIKMIAHRVRIFDAQWAGRTTAAVQRVQAGFDHSLPLGAMAKNQWRTSVRR